MFWLLVRISLVFTAGLVVGLNWEDHILPKVRAFIFRIFGA